jgi:hypothetical protein
MDDFALRDNYRIKSEKYLKFVSFNDCQAALSYSIIAAAARFRFHLSLGSYLYSQIIQKISDAEKTLKNHNLQKNPEVNLKSDLKDFQELKDFFLDLKKGNSNDPNISGRILKTFQKILFQEEPFDERLKILSKELRLYIKFNQKIYNEAVEDLLFPCCLIKVRVFFDVNEFKVLIHREELEVDLNYDRFSINLFRKPFVKFTSNCSFHRKPQKVQVPHSKLENFISKNPESSFYFQKFLEILNENPEEFSHHAKKSSSFISMALQEDYFSPFPDFLKIKCISCGTEDQESTFKCESGCFICNLCRTQDFFKCLSCFREYSEVEKDVLRFLNFREIEEDY